MQCIATWLTTAPPDERSERRPSRSVVLLRPVPGSSAVHDLWAGTKLLAVGGISVLLIEQKLTIAMQISDRCLVMGHGSIVFEGTPDALRGNVDIRKEWLEV